MASSSTANDWIFSEKLLRSSCEVGSWEKQMELRYKTIWFLEDIGKFLKCNRRVVASASVYFHRFFVFHSFHIHDRFDVALACLFLASKVEEWPVKLDVLISARFNLRSPNPPSEMEFKDLLKSVLIKERIILQTLNFDLIIQQPYEFIWNKIRELKSRVPDRNNRDSLYQTSLQFVNDSYRSTTCLEFAPSEVGVACVFLAALQLDITPANADPKSTLAQSWFDIFDGDIKEESLRSICSRSLQTNERSVNLHAAKSLSLKQQVLQFPTIANFGLLAESHPIELNKSGAADEMKMQESPHTGGVSAAGGSPTASSGSGAMMAAEDEDSEYLFQTEVDGVGKQRKVTVSMFLTSSGTGVASSGGVSKAYELPQNAPNDSPASSTYSSFSNINDGKAANGLATRLPVGDDTPVHYPPLQNSFATVPGSAAPKNPSYMDDEQHWSKKLRTS